MSYLHTFSIIAKDWKSSQIGVAVQTHWFAVGALCPWIEAGIGAVATQSMVEVSYGPKGLELLRAGKSPQEALDILLAADKNNPVRQVAIVDAIGRIAVHTGDRCIAEAGHQTGNGFSVQANMMLKPTVWLAMADAFEKSKGNLAQRLMSALKAGQSEGGDIRGSQSAAMLVAEGKRTDEPWKNLPIDLRVDDHPEPIRELERLLNINQAYELMNKGDELLSQDHTDEAREKYKKAAKLAPDIDELPFWQAVTLADSGSLVDALPIFRELFRKNQNWVKLVKRLPASGLLKDDKEMMRKILACK